MSMRASYAAILSLAVSTTGAAQGSSTISAHGIGGILLCQPITAVQDKFPHARDSLVSSEGSKWPAKIVPLGGGQQIVFEASWVDTSHVWRIRTNSPRYRTAHGYQVGATLGQLREKHESLRFSYEEGYIVIRLVSDRVDILPDDSTAKAFLARSPKAFDSLEALPRSARIKEIIVSGDCRR